MTMPRRTRHILLTGPPGCGKTTVVQKLVERLADRRLAGFYTRAIRLRGRRVGFEAVGLHLQTRVLAHVESRSPARVGKYGVELDAFEKRLRAELNRCPEEVDLYVIDEIGRMECLSRSFIEAVRRILDGPVPLLATVALKGSGFIREVKTRSRFRRGAQRRKRSSMVRKLNPY